MRTKLGKKIYDTDQAELVHQFAYSYWGDPAGYEERLYRTSDGFYFLYVNGGEASPYPAEKILRIRKDAVSAYLSELSR